MAARKHPIIQEIDPVQPNELKNIEENKENGND